MSDDQFTKLFVYMNERFDKIEARMDGLATREELDRVYRLLDDHIKQRKADEQERLAMGQRLGLHEGWITQLAEKTNTRLEPSP